MVQSSAPSQMHDNVTLVRILGKDVRGDMKLLAGLTTIKGLSWPFAHALCTVLNLDPHIRIQDLSKKQLLLLESFSEELEIPSFMKNRQKDFDSGKDLHLIGADLSLRKEFDIKRLRKIKSYRGSRHAVGLPSRGQRTKSNFRRNRKKSGAVGVRKKK